VAITKKPTTDAQAFHSVRSNLQREVGEFLAYVAKQKVPLHIYWAFLRMLFPVAESLGDLAYRADSSTNLLKILREEYASVNPSYGKLAALLIYIYRHSLTHTDALREIEFEDKKISWALTPNWLTAGHLDLTGTSNRYKRVDGRTIETGEPYVIRITFSVKQFYEDTLAVCNRMYNTSRKFNGDVGRRYDEWRILPLERKIKNTKIEKEAIGEINDLMKL